jgi:predicted transposase YbfD/YdcC
MNILDLINQIPDPRMVGKVIHNLGSIIFVTLCGVLSNCETWSDISDYCEIKKDWLSQYVNLSNGIPSEWTFRRVFTLLDPNCLEALLRNYAAYVVNKNKPSDQIAVDGKSLCSSKTNSLECLKSVSLWCHENGLVIAEKQVADKSHETKTIPLLLQSMNIKDATVTIDAAGCHKNIAQIIRDKKGHYLLALKGNNPKLYHAVKNHIQNLGEINRLDDAFDMGHGRTVRRRYFAYDLRSLDAIKDWQGASSAIAVETISMKDSGPNRKVHAEWRYYISSHPHTNQKLPEYVRNHWGIENKLHWILDVHLKEDDDQKAERKSARSFALLRRIALNIVRTKDLTKKRSLRRKLKRSGWDNNYLLSLLLEP